MQWDEILPLVVRRSFVALVIIQGLIPIFSCRSSLHFSVKRSSRYPSVCVQGCGAVTCSLNSISPLAGFFCSPCWGWPGPCSPRDKGNGGACGRVTDGAISVLSTGALSGAGSLHCVCRHCRGHVWCLSRAALAVPGHVSAAARQKSKPRGWD